MDSSRDALQPGELTNFLNLTVGSSTLSSPLSLWGISSVVEHQTCFYSSFNLCILTQYLYISNNKKNELICPVL